MTPVIAVLGLGEAGSEVAADLVAAGAIVHAFDPKVPAPAAILGFGNDADAARLASGRPVTDQRTRGCFRRCSRRFLA